MTHPPKRPTGNRIDQSPADAPPLAGYGALDVGVTTLHLADAARPMTVELWHPCQPETGQDLPYATLLRDGVTGVRLHGRARRNARAAAGNWPLVILSHGYPGNRMLMAHFGETLASRGFVVVAADHPGSTYDDKAAFGITLLHRPLDQAFLLHSMMDHPVWGPRLLPAAAVIGYSMGAYGAMVFGGAGLSPAALAYGAAPPDLARHAAGSASHAALRDPRLKAVVPIGLWGGQHGFWDDATLAAMTLPCLMIAGSDDQISGYATGMERVFKGLTHRDQHLLTFDGAGHNAAAPIPAPEESWTPALGLDFLPAEHYADPVWDTTRMNAAAQHIVTLFLRRHLNDSADRVTLDAFPRASWQGLTLTHPLTHAR